VVIIVGASKLTRMILTSVAISPVSSDIEKPAPTTWATSWIVPYAQPPLHRCDEFGLSNRLGTCPVYPVVWGWRLP
jgi:hypothetical protein